MTSTRCGKDEGARGNKYQEQRAFNIRAAPRVACACDAAVPLFRHLGRVSRRGNPAEDAEERVMRASELEQDAVKGQAPSMMT